MVSKKKWILCKFSGEKRKIHPFAPEKIHMFRLSDHGGIQPKKANEDARCYIVPVWKLDG